MNTDGQQSITNEQQLGYQLERWYQYNINFGETCFLYNTDMGSPYPFPYTESVYFKSLILP